MATTEPIALLERVTTPEHIASAITWLLDPACLMTGQLMVVDGGFNLALRRANQTAGR